MPGILYVVATPIGNLDDLTPRAAATFGSVDFIAAEDTRVTLKLLNHLGLKKPLVSYYEHNLRQRGEMILARILAGENCALCSDAGMPAVSDPGELLVRDALAAGIRVVPIPAASACVSALAVSGQATGRFVFEGFLPTNRRQRAERLAKLAGEERTMLFYEAPHKLRMTLDDLIAAFGPDRSVTLARELTKLHEEVVKTTLGEAAEKYRELTPRGEFVLVLAGAAPTSPRAFGKGPPPSQSWGGLPAFGSASPREAELTLEQTAERARALQAEGMPASAAAREAAKGTPFSKSQIYRLLAGRKDA